MQAADDALLPFALLKYVCLWFGQTHREKLGRKGILCSSRILWRNENCLVRIEKISGSAIQDPGSWIFISVQEEVVSKELLALYVCSVSFAAVFFKQAKAKDSLA